MALSQYFVNKINVKSHIKTINNNNNSVNGNINNILIM